MRAACLKKGLNQAFLGRHFCMRMFQICILQRRYPCLFNVYLFLQLTLSLGMRTLLFHFCLSVYWKIGENGCRVGRKHPKTNFLLIWILCRKKDCVLREKKQKSLANALLKPLFIYLPSLSQAATAFGFSPMRIGSVVVDRRKRRKL